MEIENNPLPTYAREVGYEGFFMKSERTGFDLWRPEDIPLATLLWGDAEVTKLIDSRGRLTEEDIVEKLQRELDSQTSHGIQYWPVFELESGEFIGCCGLRPHDEKGTIELGIHLRPAYWGQGFTLEILHRVIDHAFITLKIDSLIAGHNPQNHRSHALMGKLGFVHTHDAIYPPTGLLHPYYRLYREKWNP